MLQLLLLITHRMTSRVAWLALLPLLGACSVTKDRNVYPPKNRHGKRGTLMFRAYAGAVTAVT